MAERKTILVRLRPEHYAALRRWAADEFRSVNGQLEYIVQRALGAAGRLPRGGGGSDSGEAGEAGEAGATGVRGETGQTGEAAADDSDPNAPREGKARHDPK